MKLDYGIKLYFRLYRHIIYILWGVDRHQYLIRYTIQPSLLIETQAKKNTECAIRDKCLVQTQAAKYALWLETKYQAQYCTEQ